MISIIILNWNGKEVTEECLKSIKKQTFKGYETIVVDNNSSDNSVSFLNKKFPSIKLVQNKKNLGFTGGNNEGLKYAKGDYLLLLNNDTILDKNFLEEIWKNKNKADILGVKNYFYGKKNMIWAVGSKVNWLTMRAKLIANKLIDSREIDKIKIDHAVGSAIFFRKKIIEKIGFLDNSFFAYYEETEWQTRAQRAGFKISWVPTAKLWHKVAYSTGGGRSPLSAYYLVRNRGYYIKKYSKHKFIAYLFWLIEIKLRILYGLLKDRKYAKMTWKGMVDFFNDKKGKLI